MLMGAGAREPQEDKGASVLKTDPGWGWARGREMGPLLWGDLWGGAEGWAVGCASGLRAWSKALGGGGAGEQDLWL